MGLNCVPGILSRALVFHSLLYRRIGSTISPVYDQDTNKAVFNNSYLFEKLSSIIVVIVPENDLIICE
jgi:hypothetical protein